MSTRAKGDRKGATCTSSALACALDLSRLNLARTTCHSLMSFSTGAAVTRSPRKSQPQICSSFRSRVRRAAARERWSDIEM